MLANCALGTGTRDSSACATPHHGHFPRWPSVYNEVKPRSQICRCLLLVACFRVQCRNAIVNTVPHMNSHAEQRMHDSVACKSYRWDCTQQKYGPHYCSDHCNSGAWHRQCSVDHVTVLVPEPWLLATVWLGHMQPCTVLVNWFESKPLSMTLLSFR